MNTIIWLGGALLIAIFIMAQTLLLLIFVKLFKQGKITLIEGLKIVLLCSLLITITSYLIASVIIPIFINLFLSTPYSSLADSSPAQFGLLLSAFGFILIGITSFLIFWYVFTRFIKIGIGRLLGIYIFYTVTSMLLGLMFSSLLKPVLNTYILEGNSMYPNLKPGSYLIVNKLDRNFARFDVVSYTAIDNPNKVIISRIIGLPGEILETRDKNIYINGQEIYESYIASPPETTMEENTVFLGEDQYFVLGDNRLDSIDYGSIRPIEKNDIIGKIIL